MQEDLVPNGALTARRGHRKSRERITLTDRKIASIKPMPGRILDLADSVVHGLHLRVRESGNKSWSVVLRQGGRFRRFSLGQYPGMGLAEARNAAQAILPQLRKGHDPISERRAQRAVQDASGVVTLKDLLGAYERIVIPHKERTKSWPQMRSTIERVFKSALPVPVTQLRKSHLQFGLDETVITAPVTARMAWESISPVLRWAEKRELVQPGLRERIAPPAPSVRRRRDRVLTDEELRAVWKVLDEERYPFGHLYKLLLLTGQRRGEVAAMEWSEIDLEAATWTIPRDKTKQSRDQVVPLVKEAAEILESAKRLRRPRSKLVFCTSMASNGDKTTGGKPVGNWARVHRRVLRESNTSGWTKHDLRRTVATHLGRLGIAPHIIEHVLGHADPLASSGLSSVAGVYQRYDYAKEKRDALEKWATSLRDILAGRSNVIPLARTHGKP